ncbi:MAG: hypothetical protein QM541_12375 [Flavobacterium sp.]|nr:hypothetical protein [Flavobacterium sp.]
MIHTHNYEEFFLMYVDGELSTTDKQMVEAFVQLHPHLQEELAMLQQTVLLPENDIVFADKNLLFKHTESNNNATIYEEKLLLYIDNELTTQHKAALETVLLSNATLQNDLALLQQTKLPIENIACPNKAALYKEEKKPSVVYMTWQYMAAAIVIGLVATVYFVVPSGKTTNASLASVDDVIKSTTPVILPSTTTVDEIPVTEAPKNDIATATLASTNKAAKQLPVTQALVTTQQPVVASNTLKPFKEGAQAFLASPPKNVENIIADAVTNAATNRNNNSTAKNDLIDASAPSLQAVTNPLNTTNIAAQQVVYKELDTNSDDKSLLVGSIEINKDKLRGFLRKASKLFGNKQKNDDDTKSSLATNK